MTNNIFKVLSTLLLLLLVKKLVKAQVSLPGKCPEAKIKQNFELEPFMGLWYEYSQYPFLAEVGMDCGTMEFKNLGNGTITMTSSAISQLTHTSTSFRINAKILGPARFFLNLNRSNKKKQIGNRANFVIIGTDYNNYALVLSCLEFRDAYHQENVWILTRERKPSEQAVNKAKDLMIENGLSKRYLLDNEQDDCPDTQDEVVTYSEWPQL